MTQKENKDLTKKKQVHDFKKKADDFNQGLYSDLSSYKIGLIVVLGIVSIIMVYLFFFK